MKKFAISVALLTSLLASFLSTPLIIYASTNNSSTAVVSDIKIEADGDGKVDKFERKSDGIYLNGRFYVELQYISSATLKSVAPNLNKLYFVSNSRGTSTNASSSGNLVIL